MGQHISDLLSGRRTFKEVAINMAKSPATKVFSAFGPQVTLPVGLGLRQKTFPDPLKPQRVYDRWEYLFDSFGLKDEYREFTGKPTPGYGKSVSKIFIYKSDPEQSAYYATRDEKARFMKKINKYSRVEGEPTRRSITKLNCHAKG